MEVNGGHGHYTHPSATVSLPTLWVTRADKKNETFPRLDMHFLLSTFVNTADTVSTKERPSQGTLKFGSTSLFLPSPP